MYFVYELWNPLTNQPFYVGVGTRSITTYRPLQHISEAMRPILRGNLHKLYTIRKILDAGLDVIIKEVYEHENRDMVLKEEIRRISIYGRSDVGTGILTNMTNGGDGLVGARVTLYDRFLVFLDGRTPQEAFGERYSDIKRRQGAKIRGIPLKELHRRRISESMKGKNSDGTKRWNYGLTKEDDPRLAHVSEVMTNRLKGKSYEEIYGLDKALEVRTKIGASQKGRRGGMLGKKHSDETKQRIAESNRVAIAEGRKRTNKGIIYSQETIERMRQAHIGKQHTEESKAKMSLVQKGRIVSEETRERLRQSRLGLTYEDVMSPEAASRMREQKRQLMIERNKKLGNPMNDFFSKMTPEEYYQYIKKHSITSKSNYAIKHYGQVIGEVFRGIFTERYDELCKYSTKVIVTRVLKLA